MTSIVPIALYMTSDHWANYKVAWTWTRAAVILDGKRDARSVRRRYWQRTWSKELGLWSDCDANRRHETPLFKQWHKYRVTQKKRELLKNPTKIEEIQEKKFDRNWTITTLSHSAEHATHTGWHKRTGTSKMCSGSERMHTWRTTPSTGRNFQTLIMWITVS